jgi:heavy metal sensor kinase
VKVRSLRFKLGLNHGLIVAVMLFAVGVARYQTVFYRSQRGFDQDLEADARLFASQFKISDRGVSWKNELAIADILTLEGFRPYFVLTDADGRILRPDLLGRYMQEMLARNSLNEVLVQRLGFCNAEAPDGTAFRFFSIAMPSVGDAPPLILHVGRQMDTLQGVLREYQAIYIYSIPIVVVLSVLVEWLLAARALRPFEEVAQTANQITSKNLNTQIVSRRNEAEIQGLVDSFNEMVRRLNASFEQIRKFNADVAHELRTPLAIMQGENEVALRSANLSDETRSVLASNLEELERLTRVVNDLLTLSEAEAGRQVMTRRPINLRTLLEDLVEQMQLLAADQSVAIRLADIPDAVIDGDELWIRRALLNLLDNAIKYSKPEGIIELSGSIREGMVRIEIHDQGIGIAEADIPFIFDRLFRADKARSRASGGAGLGLALVKWVVEAHQGQIHVTSAIDRGSSFELDFPLRAARPAVS